VNGRIYLIPVTLGGNDFLKVIPEKVISLTTELRHFIVEDIRSARRYLRMIDREFPIDDTQFFELNEHTTEAEITHYLDPALRGCDMGIMSEAGLPGIADPGAMAVAMAHRKGLTVSPLSGPSSIIMALISSGLNGQNFTFNGYLPVRHADREAKLRDLEKASAAGVAQIFMETPYRNQKMLESILSVCRNETLLCIASDVSLPSESIKTKRIAVWKNDPPELKDRLVVFVLQ